MNYNMNNQNFYSNQYYNNSNNGVKWVQGIEGAKAYQLAPNSNTILLDSEIENRFYIKVSDNVGMCNLRIFDYVEVTDKINNTNKNIDLSQYVTKAELSTLLKEILESERTVSTTDGESKPATKQSNIKF
jgi:hypothetical protein